MSTTPTPPKAKPARVINLGCLSAAVWRRDGDDGAVWFAVTFDRSYKDGDDWKHTDSFNRDDLLAVAKLADLAHTWIFAEQARIRAEEAKQKGQVQ